MAIRLGSWSRQSFLYRGGDRSSNSPALVAGCLVVIKPSGFTPFTALALGVLAERAGFPKGAVNIVTGEPVGIAGIYDAFAEKLTNVVGSIKLGDGFEEGVEIGPMINQAAIAKIKSHLEDSTAKGGPSLLVAINQTAKPASSALPSSQV